MRHPCRRRLAGALALAAVIFAFPAGLSAGGAAEPRAAAGKDTLESGAFVKFTGRLDVFGNEPFTVALIRLEDGRTYLVDPDQWAKERWDTGTFDFSGRLYPGRPAAPGLGVPPHDNVVRLVSAIEKKS